tara:strand:- start:5952 stop:6230 length:279 start_codon:yes stop_codon:yes gene_type:complete
MSKLFFLYARYSHSLIAKFIELLGKLYSLDDERMSDREARIRLNAILKNFERKASHLHDDMITYHFLDSKLQLNKNEQEFSHINMKFKYIIN